MKINIFYNTPLPRYYRVTSKYKKTVLAALGKFAKQKGEVNLVIVGSKEILRINKQFLGHNYVTDTIAFNHPFYKPAQDAPFGDIFICFDQAKKQAGEQNHGALFELLVLAAHGALHLAGLDDSTTKERSIMNKKAENLARKTL